MPRTPRLQNAELEKCLERDGYVVLPQFLDAAEITYLLEVFAKYDSPFHQSPISASILSADVDYRVAVDREIKNVLRPKADALFHEYRHCFSNFVVKVMEAEGSAGAVPLHQDPSFVDETKYDAVSIWCPLVDVDAGSGCLQFAPGSHRLNRGPRAPFTPYPYRALDALIEKTALKTEAMRAGDVVLFYENVIHGSQPNRQTAPRIVVTGLFVPREAELWYYYRDPKAPSRLEVFAVDDLFYTRCKYGSRPEDVPKIGEVPYFYDPIPPERFGAPSDPVPGMQRRRWTRRIVDRVRKLLSAVP